MVKSRNDIESIRNAIVLAGKVQGVFIKQRKYKMTKKARNKYIRSDCLSESGAIDCDDAWFLYEYALHHDIKNIIEIGTWFGTSAAIMLAGILDRNEDGTVYTCDKKRMFIGNDKIADIMGTNKRGIVYKNIKSGLLLSKIIKSRICIQMAFIDGRLEKGDGKRLFKVFGVNKLIVAVHDRLDKGLHNMRLIRREIPGAMWNIYNTTPMMAIMEQQ